MHTFTWLVQNTAARVLTKTNKREHVTLKSLYWLLVCCRIDFKIVLLVYKAPNALVPPYKGNSWKFTPILYMMDRKIDTLS